MSDQERERPSLKDFDAYADRNGQDLGQDSPLDIGNPARTQKDLKSEPGGEAQAARNASGTPGEDATDQTEAETPAENLQRIRAGGSGTSIGGEQAQDAIERATAVVGDDEVGAS